MLLQNFFVTGEDGRLPELILGNGDRVSSADFLRALDPDLDLVTAAGPAASSSSGGVGEYLSDSGALPDSVERLESLDGAGEWNSGFATSAVSVSAARPTGAALSGDAASTPDYALSVPDDAVSVPDDPISVPEDGGVVVPPVIEPADYHGRLVVAGSEEGSFSFMAVDGNGNPVTNGNLVNVAFKDGSTYFTIVGVAANGEITVKLTEEGVAALRGGEDFTDVLTVVAGNTEYQMLLTGKDQKAYDSGVEERAADLDTWLNAEWYASGTSVEDADIVLGGSGYNGVDISAADGGDALTNTTIDVGGSAKSFINITGDVSGDSVFYGGDDVITITGELSGGVVSGDTDRAINAGAGGDDTITIGAMTGGTVYGDGRLLPGGAGDDVIHIGEMGGGSVYGDGSSYSGMGNDTITIDSFTNADAAKTIWGGSGADLFVYNDTEGHALALSEDTNGTVSIDGSTAYMNAAIFGFEGLGGGSGDDMLTGNGYGNILLGGAGNDTLTGGGGSDTFVWLLGDQGTADAPARDVIKDFKKAEGDKLDLSSLLGDEVNEDNLSDYLGVSTEGRSTVVSISTDGNMADGHCDQTIVLENTNISYDDLVHYIILTTQS